MNLPINGNAKYGNEKKPEYMFLLTSPLILVLIAGKLILLS